MKKIKFFLLGFVGVLFFGNFWFCEIIVPEHADYILFYAEKCPHCQEVEQFLGEYDLVEKYEIELVEVRQERKNLERFQEYLEGFGLTEDHLSVPFLVIDNEASCNYAHGSTHIINLFETLLGLEISDWENLICDGDMVVCEQLTCEEDTLVANLGEEESLVKRMSFFGIMLPAAFADSINPCAFAVILLLLWGILSREKNRKKALWAWILFSLAVFVSYFVMGIGLFSALATATNVFVIKIVVGFLGVLVGLANLKDYFRYGKWFVMEVPFGRRPKMKKIIDKAVSPWWAFVVWLVVSLFLLPCTSGPYFTILGYLASENSSLNIRGIIYLLVYNLIFILPMLVIVWLVSGGWKTAEELAMFKNKNNKIIHLIVGLLMFGLGMYVFGDVFGRWFLIFR